MGQFFGLQFDNNQFASNQFDGESDPNTMSGSATINLWGTGDALQPLGFTSGTALIRLWGTGNVLQPEDVRTTGAILAGIRSRTYDGPFVPTKIVHISAVKTVETVESPYSSSDDLAILRSSERMLAELLEKVGSSDYTIPRFQSLDDMLRSVKTSGQPKTVELTVNADKRPANDDEMCAILTLIMALED